MTNRFRVIFISLALLSGCEINDVSDLPAERFACEANGNCPAADASIIRDVRVFDSAVLDAGPNDFGLMDAAVPSLDSGPAADFGLHEDGHVQNPGADSGPEITYIDIPTSTSCHWRASDGSDRCDAPIRIQPGKNHTCASRELGGVACWGKNTDGQLGDGTNINRNSPVTVLGLTDTTTIAVGRFHSCAISQGQVYCWGKNEYGQLGLDPGVFRNISFPMLVRNHSGLPLRNIIEIATGHNHSCALASNYDLYCWGDNRERQAGQLGLDSLSTARLVAEPRNYASVAAGGNSTCTIVESSSTSDDIYCWGDNDSGQIGIDFADNYVTNEQSSAVSFPDTSTTGNVIMEVLLGDRHVCSRNKSPIQDGGFAVFCWGDNAEGQVVFDSSIQYYDQPEIPFWPFLDNTRVPLHSDLAIAVGANHNCAFPQFPTLARNALFYCWGKNDRYQIGLRATNLKAKIEATPFVSTKVYAGGNTSCVLLTDGTPECWGDNRERQLGDGSLALATVPLPVPDLSNVASLVAANGFNCAIAAPMSVYSRAVCWGRNDFGQLGNDTTEQSSSPVVVSRNNQSVTGVLSAGNDHVCIADDIDDDFYCWGSDHFGQLSSSLASDASLVAVEVQARAHALLGGNGSIEPASNWASHIEAGGNYTCVYANGAPLSRGVACAGRNDHGQLMSSMGAAVDIADARNSLAPLTLGDKLIGGTGFGCWLSSTGTVRCAGSNEFGQLGPAAVGWSFSNQPVAINLSQAVYDLDLGNGFACAITSSGSAPRELECWGRNHVGQFGAGHSTSSATSTTGARVMGRGPLIGISQVSTGDSHACAVLGNSHIYCWGKNDVGQVGDGSRLNQSFASRVASASPAESVHAGTNHSCTITNQRTVECWGGNDFEQLGHPNRSRRSEPYPVVQAR